MHDRARNPGRCEGLRPGLAEPPHRPTDVGVPPLVPGRDEHVDPDHVVVEPDRSTAAPSTHHVDPAFGTRVKVDNVERLRRTDHNRRRADFQYTYGRGIDPIPKSGAEEIGGRAEPFLDSPGLGQAGSHVSSLARLGSFEKTSGIGRFRPSRFCSLPISSTWFHRTSETTMPLAPARAVRPERCR